MLSFRSARCLRRRAWRRWLSVLRGGEVARRGVASGGAAGRDSAVVCAAPAVVSGSSGRLERGLCDPAGGSAAAGSWIARRWRAALGDVVDRHESLRTIFPERLGVARQEVLAAGTARPRLSVAAVSAGELAGALAAAAGGGFDLAREPPLRAHLFALGEREHVLLVLLHHIAGDGWSLAPLLRDVARCYGARCAGGAAALPALPVQYADYTLWQHAVLGSEEDAAERDGAPACVLARAAGRAAGSD